MGKGINGRMKGKAKENPGEEGRVQTKMATTGITQWHPYLVAPKKDPNSSLSLCFTVSHMLREWRQQCTQAFILLYWLEKCFIAFFSLQLESKGKSNPMLTLLCLFLLRAQGTSPTWAKFEPATLPSWEPSSPGYRMAPIALGQPLTGASLGSNEKWNCNNNNCQGFCRGLHVLNKIKRSEGHLKMIEHHTNL